MQGLAITESIHSAKSALSEAVAQAEVDLWRHKEGEGASEVVSEVVSEVTGRVAHAPK